MTQAIVFLFTWAKAKWNGFSIILGKTKTFARVDRRWVVRVWERMRFFFFCFLVWNAFVRKMNGDLLGCRCQWHWKKIVVRNTHGSCCFEEPEINHRRISQISSCAAIALCCPFLFIFIYWIPLIAMPSTICLVTSLGHFMPQLLFFLRNSTVERWTPAPCVKWQEQTEMPFHAVLCLSSPPAPSIEFITLDHLHIPPISFYIHSNAALMAFM